MSKDINWEGVDLPSLGNTTLNEPIKGLDDIDWSGINLPTNLAAQTFKSDIPKEDRYVAGEGILGSALDALDYAGNVSRSAIKGASEGGFSTALEYAKQALAKERRTSATEIKDIATKAAGLGVIRAGADDNVFQWGDVIDFGLDLFVDVFTDPLSMASLGVGSALKGGKVAKALGKTGKAASKGKAELEGFKVGAMPTMTKAAENVAKFESAGTAALGGLYGAGMSDKDATSMETLRNIAIGAGIAYGGKKTLPAVGEKLKATGDDIVSAWMRGTRGDKFQDFAKNRNLAVRAAEKIRSITDMLMQKRFDALEGLSPGQKLKAFDIMNDLKSEVMIGRNTKASEKRLADAVKQHGENSAEAVAAKEHLDAVYEMNKVKSRYGDKDQRFFDALNNVDNLTYEKMDPLVDSMLMREDKAIGEAIGKWTKHNEESIEELNKMTGKDIMGIKYHIQDVYDPKEVMDVKKIMDAMTTVRKGFDDRAVDTGSISVNQAHKIERSFETEKLANQMYNDLVEEASKSPMKYGLKKKMGKTISLEDPEIHEKLMAKAHDELYGTYAEKFARNYLNDAEQKAIVMMEDFAKSAPKYKGVEALENVLGKFDKMNSFLKSNLLHFSTTWLKNNYWDNMTKAYVEAGLPGVFDTAQLGLMQKNIRKDLANIYSNKMTKYSNKDIQTALEYGALEGPAFRALVSDSTEKYMNLKSVKEKLLKENVSNPFPGSDFSVDPDLMRFKAVDAGADKVAKALNNWQGFLESTVGTAGSYMEGYARMSTFLRTKQMLQGRGLTDDAVNKIAAGMTKRSFFDYGDVSYFEKAVLKRLIPFYSFYSKNLPYWMSATFDPSKAGRIVNLEKARSAIGEDPTERQQKGMTDYILHASPRFLRRGDGETVYGVAPALSFHDALKMIDPKGLSAQVIEKTNPYFKLPYELVTGKDLFTGDDLYPSDTLKGQKYLFSRGYKYIAAKKALEKLGLGKDGFVNIADSLGVETDSRGNPVSVADWNVVVDKVLSVAFPTGAVDQLVGSIGKVAYDKETFGEALSNRMLPIQTVKQSDAYANMLRGKREREERKKAKYEKRKEAYRKKREEGK